MKPVLTIAGSDSGGGAGIQADLKTMEAFGCYGMSVITAVTAQNTRQVWAVRELEAQVVEQQLQAVLSDITPQAVKIGMVYTAENVEVIVRALERWTCPDQEGGRGSPGAASLSPVGCADAHSAGGGEAFAEVQRGKRRKTARRT